MMMMQPPQEQPQQQKAEATQYNYPRPPQQEVAQNPADVMWFAPTKYNPQWEAEQNLGAPVPIQLQKLEAALDLDQLNQELHEHHGQPLSETWQLNSFDFLSIDRARRKQ
jgi:hypothetical protein